MAAQTPSTLTLAGRSILVDRMLVMGVVNASPESFSDGRTRMVPQERIEHASRLVADGADIIDVGGQSAITNQPELDEAAEIDRIVPVIEGVVRAHPGVIVSADTYRPAVAKAAIAAGASIVNDVSGLLYPDVAELCAATGAALVVMHTRARPKVRLQRADLYDDVTTDIVGFLSERMDAAAQRGLDPAAIVLDPGPDFTKTPHQTVAMLRRLDEVRALGRPLLLALSRKDFLGAITQKPPRGRDAATHAAIAYFTAQGGGIVRVHDVAAARDVIDTVEVLSGRVEIDPDYLLPDHIRHEPRV